MTDLTNHHIGRNAQPTIDDDPGCLPLLISFVVALAVCAVITFCEGCSHPKTITTTTTSAVTTSQSLVDSTNHVITITRSDTTTTVSSEYIETEITFVTTDFDTLGHTLRITEGSVIKRTDKNNKTHHASTSHKVDSTQNAVITERDSTSNTAASSVTKTSPKPAQKAYGWILAITSLILFSFILYSIYLFAKKK